MADGCEVFFEDVIDTTMEFNKEMGIDGPTGKPADRETVRRILKRQLNDNINDLSPEGQSRLVDDLSDTTRLDEIISTVGREKAALDRIVSIAIETKSQNPKESYSTILEMMTESSARPFNIANRYTNAAGEEIITTGSPGALRAEAVQADYRGRFIDPILEDFAQVKNDATAQNDLVRGFFGEATENPSMSSLGKKVKTIVDNLNEDSAKAGVSFQSSLQPNLNLFRMEQFAEQHGDNALRQLMVDTAENGSKWFDQWLLDGRQVLANNELNVKNADSWIALNNKLGDGNMMASILTSIDKQASRIGWAEDWGQNPVRTMQKAIDELEIDGAEAAKLLRLIRAATNMAHDTVDMGKFTRFHKGARAVTASAMLSKAALNTVVDWVTTSQWGRAIGVNDASHLSDFLTGPYVGKELREVARLAGIGVEDYMYNLMSSFGMNKNRFDITEGGDGGVILRNVQKATHRIMRAYGIPLATRANKQRASAQFLRAFAYNIEEGKTWNKLNRRFQVALRASGIDENQWNVLGKNNVNNGFLDPTTIDDDNLRRQVLGFVKRNADVAVISPNTFDDIALNALGADPGTKRYEFYNTIAQFYSFPYAFTRKMLGGINLQMKAAGESPGAMAMAYTRLIGFSAVAGYAIYNLRSTVDAIDDLIAGEDMEDIWNDRFNITEDKAQAEALKKTIFYGSIGGMFSDFLLTFGGLDSAIDSAYGLRTYQLGPDAVMGPFYGTAWKGVYNGITNGAKALFEWDMDELEDFGIQALKDTSRFVPANNAPGFKYFFKEYMEDMAKDIFS